MNLAAFSQEDAVDRAQIERVGNQSVQRIGRDSDDLAPSHSGGGALDRFGRGLIRINFDQVGGHSRVSVP